MNGVVILFVCAFVGLTSGVYIPSNNHYGYNPNQDYLTQGHWHNNQPYDTGSQFIGTQGDFYQNQGRFNNGLYGQDQLWRGHGQILDIPAGISTRPRRYKRSLYRSTRNNRWGNQGNIGGQWFNQRHQTTSDLLGNQGQQWGIRGQQWGNQDQVIGNQGQQWGIRGQQWENQDEIIRNQGQQWGNQDHVFGNRGLWQNDGLPRNHGQFEGNGKKQISRGHGQILDVPVGVATRPRRYKRSLYRPTRNNRWGNQGNNGGQWFNRGQQTTSGLWSNQGQLSGNRGQWWGNQDQVFGNQGQRLWVHDRPPRTQRHFGEVQGQQNSYRPRY